MPRLIWSTDDLKAAAEGGFGWSHKQTTKFFTPGAIRFFRSRVHEAIYQHRITEDGTETGFFTSSEQGPDGIRAYSVHEFEVSHSRDEDDYRRVKVTVERIGRIQDYATRSAAIHAAKTASHEAFRVAS